eukprot:s5132_g2.t2
MLATCAERVQYPAGSICCVAIFDLIIWVFRYDGPKGEVRTETFRTKKPSAEFQPRRELRVAKKNSWRKQSCSVFSKKQSPQYLAFCCCSRARQSFVSNHWQAPLQQTMHDLDRSLRSLMTDAFDLWSRSCTVIAFNAARALGSAIPSTEVELWRITYLISILTSFGGPISVPVFECFFIPGTCYTGKQCNTACRSTPRMLSELLFVLL